MSTEVVSPRSAGVAKLETGISGFDDVALGGLTVGRLTAVAGPPGSAKTVFAGPFLAEGVRRGQGGVFVTLEESSADLRANMATLGWDIPAWEQAGLWRFVDASPLMTPDHGTLAPYSVDTLVSQIAHACDATAAQRLALDSISALLTVLDPRAARQQLRLLAVELRRLGLTSVVTVEVAGDPDGAHSKIGVEEFVADNVLLLKNLREQNMRRRTLELLKMRGAAHRKGDYSFTVLPGRGIVVLPTALRGDRQRSTAERVSSGNAALDRLCHGGFLRGSVVLVSGATGTGKTLLATEFLAGGAAAGERSLYLAFEEAREQIRRNALAWGHGFDRWEREGALRIVPLQPEVSSLEDHLIAIQEEVEAFTPTRLVVDSLSALERVGSFEGYRQFVLALNSFVKEQGITTLLTAATPTLLGGTSITEGHISTLTDGIVLLRYVELNGSVRRGIAVLKMRGTGHDSDIHQFTISGNGMDIGEPFRSVGGILTGNVVKLLPAGEVSEDPTGGTTT